MKILNSISLIVLIFILFSCEDYNRKIIEFEEIGFEPLMVLNARVVSTSDSLLISISKNVNYAESANAQFEKISGATITFTIDGTESYTAIEADFSASEKLNPFNYLVTFDTNQELSGKSFEIVAEHPDYKTVRSVITLPSNSEVEDIVFIPDARVTTQFGYPYEWDGVDLTILDNPDSDNFYFLDVVGRSGLDTIIYEIEPGVLDTIIGNFGGGSFNTEAEEFGALNVNGGVLISDENFNGTNKTVRLFYEDYSFEPTDKFVEIRNISRSDYLFIQSYDLYQNSQDFGFFSEPTTLYSNIENGLGLFSAQDVKTFLIPK